MIAIDVHIIDSLNRILVRVGENHALLALHGFNDEQSLANRRVDHRALAFIGSQRDESPFALKRLERDHLLVGIAAFEGGKEEADAFARFDSAVRVFNACSCLVLMRVWIS